MTYNPNGTLYIYIIYTRRAKNRRDRKGGATLTTLSKTGELSFSSSMVTLNVHTSSSCGFPLSVALTDRYTSFCRVGSSRSNICKNNKTAINVRRPVRRTRSRAKERDRRHIPPRRFGSDAATRGRLSRLARSRSERLGGVTTTKELRTRLPSRDCDVTNATTFAVLCSSFSNVFRFIYFLIYYLLVFFPFGIRIRKFFLILLRNGHFVNRRKNTGGKVPHHEFKYHVIY